MLVATTELVELKGLFVGAVVDLAVVMNGLTTLGLAWGFKKGLFYAVAEEEAKKGLLA